MAIRNVPRRARLLLTAVLVPLPFVTACGPAAVAGNPSDFSINTYAGQRCAGISAQRCIGGLTSGPLRPAHVPL